MSRFVPLALLGLLLAGPSVAQTTTVSADITADVTWAPPTEYLLDGLIFVRPGVELTIEPGTVIRGAATPSSGTGDLASGLVIMVGATIDAQGTAADPIIMTAESDNLNGNLGPDDRAEWGGLIVLGRATTNSTPGINNIEGVPPTDDTRFGCDDSVTGFECNDEESSGTIRYVSLRHGGFGFETDSEINGMTFGAVGSGTTVEFVEVFANSDDAFEFFGGTVGVKHLVGAYSGDDTFDTDRGFRGTFQFGFSVNNPGNDAGRCLENDGGSSSLGGEDATPFSNPIYSNITCIGAGEDADDSQLGEDENSSALQLRDNTGGKIYNSIFADYPGSAVDLEALSSGEDTENRFGTNTEGTDDLIIRNNIFFAFDAGDTFDDLVDDDGDNSEARQDAIEAALAGGNTVVDPELGNLDSRDVEDGSGFDPRPSASGPAASGAQFTGNALENDAFFTVVDYLGAFEPGVPVWADNWTRTSDFLSDFATPVEGGPEAAFALTVGPNPTAGDATVRFSLDEAQDVRIALYDVLGRQVAIVAEGAFGAGEQVARVATGSLPAGVYVLRLDGETAAASRQISVVR
ncbi:MAG: T9SS type A sorting domain-containing protein [Bacteroidota bacterium]